MTDVETIKQKRGGDCEIFVYPNGGHGFHCDERGSFDKGSARPPGSAPPSSSPST